MLRTARALIDAKIPAPAHPPLAREAAARAARLDAAVGPVDQRGRRSRRGARRRGPPPGRQRPVPAGTRPEPAGRRAAGGRAPQRAARRRPASSAGARLVCSKRSRSRAAIREAALAAWQRAVDEDPHDAAAWTNWGRLLHEQGRRQQAAEVYRRALAAGRRRCAAAVQPGRAARGSGRSGARRSRRTRARSSRIRISPTVTTISRGCTNRWGSPSTPSGTSGNTGACWAATAADARGAHANLGRHVRVQLPRVEGQLLSAEAAGGEDAGVLRAGVQHRRGQLHLLPHAQRQDPRRLGPRHTRRLSGSR